jgi:NADPH-dependent 2,4-dienoyl-CoA reductase/sulfur reductase-like enzyme
LKQLIIIGGSDAGISAALRARELQPEVNVTVVVADRYPNFSICGLPFLLSGEVEDWQTLAHRTAAEIEREGIRLLLEHRATAIDPGAKAVSVAARDGHESKLAYDRLVIGTGAVSVRPSIGGIELPGVFLLRWMDDAFAMSSRLKDGHRRSAVIVGAGYIGMEMADALTYRGMQVTVVEFADSVLTTVDPELGQRIQAQLEEHGVRVATGVTVSRIERSGEGHVVHGSGTFAAAADIVLVAVGARPQTDLALTAGAESGTKGAIKVDRFMRTNVADIYAAGDCVET